MYNVSEDSLPKDPPSRSGYDLLIMGSVEDELDYYVYDGREVCSCHLLPFRTNGHSWSPYC